MYSPMFCSSDVKIPEKTNMIHVMLITVTLLSLQEIFVIQFCCFFFLSAAYMNNPHSTGGPQSTPALGTGGHPFVGPQPTLSTPVSELSRICSLVGMSQPDFSFIKTPQVKLVFCKSWSSQLSFHCPLLNIWTKYWNLCKKWSLAPFVPIFFKANNKAPVSILLFVCLQYKCPEKACLIFLDYDRLSHKIIQWIVGSWTTVSFWSWSKGESCTFCFTAFGEDSKESSKMFVSVVLGLFVIHHLLIFFKELCRS